MSPLSFRVLTLIIRENEVMDSILSRLAAYLAEHQQPGLIEELSRNLQGRARSACRRKQAATGPERKVGDLTQKQTVEILAVSKKTVQGLWQRKFEKYGFGHKAEQENFYSMNTK